MSIFSAVIENIKYFFELPAILIDKIGFLPEFAKDALIDSINLIPFLFIIFLIIEAIELYYAKKKHLFVFFMKKIGPLFGSLFATIPQCGFSVISSTLYIKRILSRGTIVAIYLATSDEAIPVLVANPSKAYLILPIIVLKVIIAIIVGYIVDVVIKYKAKDKTEEEQSQDKSAVQGCCHHNVVSSNRKRDLIYHPIKHTFNIFIFILSVSLVLSFVIDKIGTEDNLANYLLINSPIQPVVASLVGLVPNCAISVALTVLFIKHSISFGSLIAGLLSSGGLGLLILINKNYDKKDTAIILGILIVVSSIIGIIIQYNMTLLTKIFSIFGLTI